MSNLSEFDAKKHICKFGFELYDHVTESQNKYSILCDLYQKSIIFDFIDKRSEKVVETVGFKLTESNINSLLPLIKCEKYEPYRDLPESEKWDINQGFCGYRDGWGYKFWYISDNGHPLFQADLDCLYNEKHLPPYEKLLSWVKNNFNNKRELKNRNMMW